MIRITPVVLYCALSLALGCSDFDPPAPSPTPGASEGGGQSDAGSDYPATPPMVDAADAAETAATTFAHAAVGSSYAFVPDTIDHAITLVHLASGVHVQVYAGAAPLRIAAAPGQDLAVVMDDLHPQAHVIRVTDGSVDVTPVDVAEGLNALAFSPDGQRAVLYHDADAPAAGAGRPSHTLASVVRLSETPVAAEVDLGDIVDEIALSDTPARLYLRLGARITYFDLEAEAPQPVALALGTPRATLRWARTGQRAVAFHPGADVLDVADLRSGPPRRLWLSSLLALQPMHAGDADAGIPAIGDLQLSDAALSEDGAHLWLALSDRGVLLDVRLPEALDDPTAATAHAYATDGTVTLALAPQGDHVAVLHGPGGARRLGVVPAAAPETAMTVELPGEPVGMAFGEARGDLLFWTTTAFGVVSPALGEARLQPTTATPRGFDWAGEVLFVATAYEGLTLPGAGVLRVEPATLEAEHVRVDSPARYLRAIEDGAAVVIDQSHPDGRLTRVSADGRQSASITGFHIDDRVKE